MEELVIVLLKLLVQLVLYAFTGKWYRFDDTNDQPAPAQDPGKPRSKRALWRMSGAPRAAAREKKPGVLPAPRAAREALQRALEAHLKGMPADADAPWFTFPDEYVEAEPQEEALGGEAASQPTFQKQKARLALPATRPVRGRPRSIASAVRDRQTQRYAVVLGAALGPRGTRR